MLRLTGTVLSLWRLSTLERVKLVNKPRHHSLIILLISYLLHRSGYLPPPIHSSQLAQRLLQQQKYERLDEGGEVEEIEMELEENEPETTTENKDMVGGSFSLAS